MNSDIEKQEIKEDGGKEQYLLDDVDKKKIQEGDEAAEDSPLKGDYEATTTDSKENDANLPEKGDKSGGKEGRSKGLREWLSKSRVKWWIAILVAIVLLTVVLVGTLLAVEDNADDFVDTGIRLMKIWPKPNKPRNVINFVHGTLPFEGRVWPDLVKELDELTSRYMNPLNKSKNVVECYGAMPPKGKVCAFDLRPIALECSKSMNYGYDQGKPCIFFEFNNISEWQPESYTTRDLESLPDLPDDLRHLYKPNLVFLDCQGDSLVDQENIGPIEYSPDRGFPTRYFPYRGQTFYMSPLIAVRFTNPAVGIAVSVTCKLWAKNVNHTDEAIPSGKFSFNLLVD